MALRIITRYPLLLSLIMISCDEVIDVNLEPAQPALVIDAFINNLNETQQIELNFSQDYFDDSQYIAATGATISVTDLTSNDIYFFIEEDPDTTPGVYSWTPASSDETFGEIGNDYILSIEYNEVNYQAFSIMTRVPTVDSIVVNIEESFFGGEEFFQAEFFARDFEGLNDTYWIKAFKNGSFLNKPAEINLAYDAGPNSGNGIDGITYTPPIRSGINPVDEEDANGDILTYEIGDQIKVQIHSITNSTHDYLTQLSIQTNRTGGFQELFADPLANLPVNIEIVNGSTEDVVLGFFSVSAVSSLEVTFTDDLIRED